MGADDVHRPVAAHRDLPALLIDFAIADPAHAQVAARKAAGRFHDLDRIEQLAQCCRQAQVKMVLELTSMDRVLNAYATAEDAFSND